jgi:hypothetical protein
MRFFAILIIGLVLFSTEQSYGQETKHSIGIGLHHGIYDGFGASGPLLRVDYNYHLNEYIQFSSFLYVGAGTNEEKSYLYTLIESYNSYGLGAQVKYIPFPKMNILKRLKFQLGVNYTIENELYTTEDTRDNAPPTEVIKDEHTLYRPIVGVEINLLNTSAISFGYTGVFNAAGLLQGYHGLILSFKLIDKL